MKIDISQPGSNIVEVLEIDYNTGNKTREVIGHVSQDVTPTMLLIELEKALNGGNLDADTKTLAVIDEVTFRELETQGISPKQNPKAFRAWLNSNHGYKVWQPKKLVNGGLK